MWETNRVWEWLIPKYRLGHVFKSLINIRVENQRTPMSVSQMAPYSLYSALLSTRARGVTQERGYLGKEGLMLMLWFKGFHVSAMGVGVYVCACVRAFLHVCVGVCVGGYQRSHKIGLCRAMVWHGRTQGPEQQYWSSVFPNLIFMRHM